MLLKILLKITFSCCCSSSLGLCVHRWHRRVVPHRLHRFQFRQQRHDNGENCCGKKTRHRLQLIHCSPFLPPPYLLYHLISFHSFSFPPMPPSFLSSLLYLFLPDVVFFMSSLSPPVGVRLLGDSDVYRRPRRVCEE